MASQVRPRALGKKKRCETDTSRRAAGCCSQRVRQALRSHNPIRSLHAWPRETRGADRLRQEVSNLLIPCLSKCNFKERRDFHTLGSSSTRTRHRCRFPPSPLFHHWPELRSSCTSGDAAAAARTRRISRSTVPATTSQDSPASNASQTDAASSHPPALQKEGYHAQLPRWCAALFSNAQTQKGFTLFPQPLPAARFPSCTPHLTPEAPPSKLRHALPPSLSHCLQWCRLLFGQAGLAPTSRTIASDVFTQLGTLDNFCASQVLEPSRRKHSSPSST